MSESVTTASPPATDAAADDSSAIVTAPTPQEERIAPAAATETETAPAKSHQQRLDASATEPPKPLTPEELADRLVPGDPRLSPDGRHVLFVVAPAGKKGEHKDSALWLSRDGAPAKPFTAGTANDHSPRWSPDGTQILFCSDRAERGSEKHKLYLIPAAGGEARPLGDLQGELSQPSWSPGGKIVAVLRKDPEPPEEKKRKEERNDAVVVDEDLKRIRLWFVEVESSKARCLTFGGRNVWSYGWSPDGERLAVCTTHSPEINSIFSPADLWTVPAAGGAASRVATFPMLADDPVFVETAGGPAIAVRANDFRDDPTTSVWLVSLADGSKRKLLADDDGGEVEGMAPLGTTTRGLALRLVERTHGLAYALDARTGKLTPLTPGGKHGAGSVIAGPSASGDGSRVAVVWSDRSTPEEVYLGAAGGEGAAVTELGKAFQDRLCPTETVTWRSSDGVEVEGILTYPAGYEPGTRYPLIVEAHGGPSWQWEDRVMLDWHDWAQYLASHAYAVLQPKPRGSTGYGAAFQKLLQDDVGGGEVDDLISGARAMVARGLADEGKLGIGGWSWGGYLTARTITKTQLFRAAMMGAGLSNMLSDHGIGDIPYANLLYYPGQPYDHPQAYWNSSPIKDIKTCTTPTLILHGEDDARVHPAQGMEFHRALRTLGVPTRFVRYPREGHPIEERLHQLDLLRRLLEWFDRYLKGIEPARV
jgi:dipeptidyl aminopeptidase/acylaminoacyl peptidase